MIEIPNSLIIPSVSALPCDDECVVQPIQVNLSEPMKGATIPIDIPDGVSICSVSTQGLVTENWDYTFININETEGYISTAFANSTGEEIPEGLSTLFNIYFHYSPACNINSYMHWDTTLYDDEFKQLKFADTSPIPQVIHPGFNVNRDSSEIRGYIPGDIDGTEEVDIADLVYIVEWQFNEGPPPCIMKAAEITGDCQIDIADLVMLVDYQFNNGPDPVACP